MGPSGAEHNALSEGRRYEIYHLHPPTSAQVGELGAKLLEKDLGTVAQINAVWICSPYVTYDAFVWPGKAINWQGPCSLFANI